MSDGLRTQFIITFGVVISALFALLAARYRYIKRPKNPSEILFSGYETLLKRQEGQYDHQQGQLNAAWETIERLQQDLDKARAIINQQQTELSEMQEENKTLIDELRKLKDHYTNEKAGAIA